MEVAASGRHSDGQLSGDPELFDEAHERGAEVVERLFFGVALAVGTDTGAQLSMRTPHPIFVALDDDRHGNGAEICHATTITRPLRDTRARCPQTSRLIEINVLAAAAGTTITRRGDHDPGPMEEAGWPRRRAGRRQIDGSGGCIRSSSAGRSTQAKPIAESLIPYGMIRASPWRRAPQE
jgi:hypothetical protein